MQTLPTSPHPQTQSEARTRALPDSVSDSAINSVGDSVPDSVPDSAPDFPADHVADYVADYVIVGGGSAGAVLAARLSEDSTCQVLLLEAGGETNRNLLVAMPSAFALAMRSKALNWGFVSEPEPGLDGRQLDCPRGRGLGGSSAINGMVYVRGHACDFDSWVAQGATGWDFTNCVPYFRRAESWAGGSTEELDERQEEATWRGKSGPIHTSCGNQMRGNPLYQAFIEAGAQAGYGTTADYNGAQQEGFGAMQMTVGKGVRSSTARGYLTRSVRNRANLRILTDCLADKVLFADTGAQGAKLKAQGVQFLHKSQKRQVVRAKKEVILSAGAIATPALLQRSGIGPEAVLRQAGVAVRHNLAGVGANLQDHLEIYFQHRCLEPITLNGKLGAFSRLAIGLRWLVRQDGLGATNHFESCGFIRSDAGVAWPDIQYHFLPGAIRYDGRSALKGHGFQVHLGVNLPSSRGQVWIDSANPETAPRILFNYLSTEQDRTNWRKAVRLTREILGQPALDPWRGEEVAPSASVQSDAEIDAFIRQAVESAYHPSCTAKMGQSDDPQAVTNPQGQVHGTDRLRVVDASLFPTIPNGNLNAPTIMVAERIADLIRGKQLPAAGVVPITDSQWQTRQRKGTALRQVA